MATKSKATLAKDAVKAALGAAKAVVDAGDGDNIAKLTGDAEAAILDAVTVAEDAKTLDDHKANLDTARAMLTDAARARAGAADAQLIEDKAAARRKRAAADEKARKKKAADAEKAAKNSHRIAEGHSLTLGARLLGPGFVVTAEDFPDGKKSLDAFVSSGHILPPGK